MSSRLLALTLLSCAAQAANLYASHYDGTVSFLTLERWEDGYMLTETSSITGCGSMPSWLSWDSASRMLYCSDEQFSGSGSITAFVADEYGKLTDVVEATANPGAVANVLYGGPDETGFLAIAHYQNSSLSTFSLPLDSSSAAQQTFEYTLDQPGTVPSRQDAPHPHHVFLDPTSGFLLVPDLGADVIRVYSIDEGSGQLSECPDIVASAGDGPRHGTFWTPAATARTRHQEPNTMLFVANELANTVSTYSVSYADICPSFSLEHVLTPYASNETAPDGTKVAEVRIKNSFLYMTNRHDQSFPPNDSITQYAISSSVSLAFQDITSSYGTYPRTFVINEAGDLAAVGDQTTANVAIMTRDVTTGKLGDMVADLRIGSAGTPEAEDGLSAVVWAE